MGVLTVDFISSLFLFVLFKFFFPLILSHYFSLHDKECLVIISAVSCRPFLIPNSRRILITSPDIRGLFRSLSTRVKARRLPMRQNHCSRIPAWLLPANSFWLMLNVRTLLLLSSLDSNAKFGKRRPKDVAIFRRAAFPDATTNSPLNIPNRI